MIPYWWMYALQGIHAQEQQIYEHPDGYGMSIYENEFIEAFIRVVKDFQSKMGQARECFLCQMFDYVDLYAVCVVIEDEVDLYEKEKEHIWRSSKLFDDISEMNIMKCENLLDEGLKNTYKLICDIEFGDMIDENTFDIDKSDSLKNMEVDVEHLNIDGRNDSMEL